MGVAVMHVVGDADRLDAAAPQRLAAEDRVGEKTFIADRVPACRHRQAAFEIAEHHVGLAQLVAHQGERHGGIGDIHEIDVAGQDHLGGHSEIPCHRQLRPPD